MNDTPRAIERKFRRMLLKRSGEERLKMGCSMHATARALAKASLLEKHPGAHPAELKRLLFLRFYGADYSPGRRNRIASALSKGGRPGKGARVRKQTTLRPLDVTDLAIVKSSGSDAVRENSEPYGGKGKVNTKRARRYSS